MKLVYYYKKNQIKYCKAIICSIKTLNDKLMKIKGPIENLHLNIKKKHDISDSDLEFKIYTYNKINGIFYKSQNEASDIVIQEETRSYIERLLA